MKLLIISHTAHYETAEGTIVGWGPTVSEINYLANSFETIYHIAFLHKGLASSSSLPYTASNIIFVPIQAVGGKSLVSKLEILVRMPKILSLVRKTLKKVDLFQLRTPTGIAVFLIPYLSLFSNKKGWYKYAGNWVQQQAPIGYKIQRLLLRMQSRKVTINGEWKGQPSQCITFENPCLLESDLSDGEVIVHKKKYVAPYSFCFVGRLEDAKGVGLLLEGFYNCKDKTKIKNIHFIGDGPNRTNYEELSKRYELPCIFHGFVERKQVFEIYSSCHFIVLPSASEGFPKVIAEAINFGCIPIVSDVSSIGQYIDSENGYLLNPISAESLTNIMTDILQNSEQVLKQKALKGQEIRWKFTFSYYLARIQQEIIGIKTAKE